MRYLKYFTFLSREEIEALEKQHDENPGAREAHKALAKAMTDLIHGRTRRRKRFAPAKFCSAADWMESPKPRSTTSPAKCRPRKLKRANWTARVRPLVELLVHAGLCPSKGQARKDIEGGGVYVNNIRETNFQRAIAASELLFGKYLLLRKGKRNYVVLTAK